MAVSHPAVINRTPEANASFYEKLNTRWHERALQIFMLVVLGHWAEHIVQAYQIYVMGMPRPMAMGLLGMWYPWMIHTEILHYGYAVVMLIGIWVFRKGFTGVSHTWWMVAFWIQFWHHFEHLLLIWQATFHHNFWGKPAPCSFLQLAFPRVELHLFYNSIVFIPMVIGMYYHLFPPKGEEPNTACTCEWRRRDSAEAA
jgi:hypothetical protein